MYMYSVTLLEWTPMGPSISSSIAVSLSQGMLICVEFYRALQTPYNTQSYLLYLIANYMECSYMYLLHILQC